MYYFKLKLFSKLLILFHTKDWFSKPRILVCAFVARNSITTVKVLHLVIFVNSVL